MSLEIYSGLKTENYVVPDVSVTDGTFGGQGFPAVIQHARNSPNCAPVASKLFLLLIT